MCLCQLLCFSVCWLCTHACPPALEWITHTRSHIISAGSPQWEIPKILLHISKEHNVFASFLHNIRGKDFYCFSDHFFYPSFLASLHILPNSITPPSPPNHPYFQTPPSVIISFLSPLIALPLFLLFLPPPFLTSYLISVHFCPPQLYPFPFSFSLSSVCLC